MVNIKIRIIPFLLLLLILVVNTSTSNTDKKHDTKDVKSEDIKMTDKMIKERKERDTPKKLCKKCTKSKYLESHKEMCSQCKNRKDSGKDDCNKCVRKKFRARNGDFCSSCPPEVVEKKKKFQNKPRNNAKKKNQKPKSPPAKAAPFVYKPIPSTGTATASTKDIELGPWGTLLKEIIQAN